MGKVSDFSFLLRNYYLCSFVIRHNKKISVFLVTGLKILGSVGTHIFF